MLFPRTTEEVCRLVREARESGTGLVSVSSELKKVREELEATVSELNTQKKLRRQDLVRHAPEFHRPRFARMFLIPEQELDLLFFCRYVQIGKFQRDRGHDPSRLVPGSRHDLHRIP